MLFNTLDSWLSWQENLYTSTIALGLDRVKAVLSRLGTGPLPYLVITVGGTNGKGSCIALLDAILRAAGYLVGTYTSPHLVRYNERIRINGIDADDITLCHAFNRIESARNSQSLTYFEFGTLAALEMFRVAKVDIALLEVGLGGRLDAVNVIDADAALVVSVDIDHVEWLGSDRNSIGYEKAGIYRTGRPAICADPNPPRSLLEHVGILSAHLRQVGRDYKFAHTGETWCWFNEIFRLEDLPLPALLGNQQLGNAAAVIETISSLRKQLTVYPDAIREGLLRVKLPGRFQIFPGPVEWILDVAHNPNAAKVLANNLKMHNHHGRTIAVTGILADKDASGIIIELADFVDHWCTATLSGPRGRTSIELANTLQQAVGTQITICNDVFTACRSAQSNAQPGDRIVVFGSFHTVAPVLVAQPWNSLITF